MIRKIIAVFATIVLVLAALFLTIVGPWPVYGPGRYEGADYYQEALAAIASEATETHIGGEPGTLEAGWSAVSMTPSLGLPLAGFGDRQGKPSEGVHDEIHVKALALSDGMDTVVIVGSDMLIVPPNVSEPVRANVSSQIPLDGGSILFNASHSHSGPGGLAPGVIPSMFWGPADPDIVPFLIERFTRAIVEAYNSLEPARLAQGTVDAKEFIRNRERDGAVDPALDFMIAEQEDGDRCFVVRYSAHATVLSGSNMEFSGDYPGFLQRAIEEATGAETVFLGGAVGSMSARAPEGADMFERAERLGDALAQRVIDASANVEFGDRYEIAAIGVPIEPPPVQIRMFSTKWRFSPILVNRLGIPLTGWMSAIRVGDLILAGTPCDFSGEIAINLRAWAQNNDYDLWALSFNGAYLGYVSPDRYYQDIFEDDGDFEYETGVMSWTGPDQEAFFTSLIKRMADALTSENLT